MAQPVATQTPLLTGTEIALCFVFSVAVFLFLVCVKRLYQLWKYGEFQARELCINSITRIAMSIALSIALIFTVSILSGNFVGMLFQVFPGSRFMLESVFVSVGGILFGPILGMFVGGVTNLLTVILTSSVFNFGYLIASIMKGFFGGLVVNLIKGGSYKSAIKGMVYLITSTMLIGLFLIYKLPPTIVGAVFGLHLTLSKQLILILFLTVSGLLFFSLAALFLCKRRFNPDWFWGWSWASIEGFVLICSAMWVSYLCVDLISLPTFDSQISTLPFQQFFMMRIFAAIPSLLTTTLLVWFIKRSGATREGLKLSTRPAFRRPVFDLRTLPTLRI